MQFHLGVVHTIELENEERGIGLQVEEVLGDAEDPGRPPLVHLQQSVGHDGVSVLPDEADALAALLERYFRGKRELANFRGALQLLDAGTSSPAPPE